MKSHDLRDPFLVDRKLVPKTIQKPLFLLSFAIFLPSRVDCEGEQDTKDDHCGSDKRLAIRLRLVILEAREVRSYLTRHKISDRAS